MAKARLTLGLTPLFVLLVMWQLVGDPSSFSFPPPSTWWQASEELWRSGELLPALGRTVNTFALGTVASVVAGVAVGWALGSSRRLARAVDPLLEFFRSMPTPALVPVATVLFGVTLEMGVIVMMIAVTWPVLLNTVTARRTIPNVRLEAGAMLGLSRVSQLWKVVLPSLVPGIMIGVRTTVSLALVVSLLIDIIGSGAGIGRLLVVRQQSFDAPSVWAILVIIGLVGLVVNAVVMIIDRQIRRSW